MTESEIPLLPHTIDGRRSMRSIADAMEALRKAQRLPEGTFADIRTCLLHPTAAELPLMVFVVSRASSLEHTWGVALPTSHAFKGRRRPGNAKETFAISLLDRAAVDEDGIVTLSDGTCLQAVDVIPAALPWKLTRLERRIVYWTIKFIARELEARFYRSGQPNPELEWLDYSQLRKLHVLKLEAILQFIANNDPELGACRQTVASALERSGMRVPLIRRPAGGARPSDGATRLPQSS